MLYWVNVDRNHLKYFREKQSSQNPTREKITDILDFRIIRRCNWHLKRLIANFIWKIDKKIDKITLRSSLRTNISRSFTLETRIDQTE